MELGLRRADDRMCLGKCQHSWDVQQTVMPLLLPLLFVNSILTKEKCSATIVFGSLSQQFSISLSTIFDVLLAHKTWRI